MDRVSLSSTSRVPAVPVHMRSIDYNYILILNIYCYYKKYIRGEVEEDKAKGRVWVQGLNSILEFDNMSDSSVK